MVDKASPSFPWRDLAEASFSSKLFQDSLEKLFALSLPGTFLLNGHILTLKHLLMFAGTMQEEREMQAHLRLAKILLVCSAREFFKHHKQVIKRAQTQFLEKNHLLFP